MEQLKAQLKEASQAADENQSKVQQAHEQNEIARQKNDISMYEAETKRIGVLKPPDPGMTPEQVQLLVMQLMQQQMPAQAMTYQAQEQQEQQPEPMEQEQQETPQEQQMMPPEGAEQNTQEPTLPGMGNDPLSQ